MVEISEKFQYLLKRETKAFAHLALTLSDGTPHVSPVWFDFDGAHFIFNTARGRVKDKVMHRRGMVAFSIVDPADPYRYILVWGRVVDETEVGGYEEICDLNEKYHGDRNYPKRSEIRVTYKVLPERIFPSK
ncbi:MAG: pyridoxamine 5'-phosphate oxidase family protein [Chloroflexota bacterium]